MSEPKAECTRYRLLTFVVLAAVVVIAGCAPAPAPQSPAFPIVPASSASYARTHHDYPAADIFAGCGTTVVAPVTGTIEDVNTVDRWRRSTDVGADRGGRWISIKGDDGVRYYGSHYQSVVAGLAIGTRVSKGQQIATVGDSGNAAGTGCHVHFGLSPTCVGYAWDTRRGMFSPQPYLDSWKTATPKSPAAEAASYC